MVPRNEKAIWSANALADLDGIWSYYFKVAGPDTAENIVRELHQGAQLIEEHPFAGRGRAEIRPGLRSIAAPPHVLFYRVEDDAPEIVRVLDGRQDIEEIFSAKTA